MSVFPKKDRLGNVLIMFLSVAASKSNSQAEFPASYILTTKGELRVGVHEGRGEFTGKQKEGRLLGLFLDRELFSSFVFF